MKSYLPLHQTFTYLFLCFLITVASAITVAPTFVTTMSPSFEAGTLQIVTSSATTSGSFSSCSQTMTFLNSYSSSPSVGYGFSFLNSNWATTSLATQTIVDLSLTSTTAGSATFLLNYTGSILLQQLTINYVACINSAQYFLDIRNTYIDLSSFSSILASNINTVRTTSLSLPYRSKSNSSNAVVIYSTVGLSMLRTSNTFDYRLSTTNYLSSSVSVTLTLQNNNGMRFIRISLINYQNIVISIDSPYFLDMNFSPLMGGNIPDSSNLGGSVLGNIFMGMTDWTLSDANAIINYNMTLTGLTYQLTSNTVTRTQSAYFWYRLSTCPVNYFNQTNVCVSCDYTCLKCSSTTNTSCVTCDSTSFRTYLSSNQSCPCNTNYNDVGVTICQAIVCDFTICSTCSSNNVCSGCVAGNYRILSNGTCSCQPYTLFIAGPACQACWPTCYSCSGPYNPSGCLSCSLSRDHRTFIAASGTCICIDGYYQTPNLASTIYLYLQIGIPCLQCQYTCATCNAITACLTCNTSLNRGFNSSSNLCSCNTGFYDSGSQTCLTCPYSCVSCSSATICLLCPSTRTLTSGSCFCSIGYYEVGVSSCQTCQYSCYTCTNSSSCSSCNVDYFRTMVNGTCNCIGGYFNVNGAQICNSCAATCHTCTGSASNNCISCDSTKMRQLASNNSCVCQTGYYETTVSGILTCSSCFYTCGSCSNSPSCISCNASNYRILSSTSCICQNKYYDDGGNQLCKSCPYYCLTCSGSIACLTCDSTSRNVTNLTTCTCNQGYYEDGVSSICPVCLSSCLTCLNPNNCTICATGRVLTSILSCVCAARTFQPYCNPCVYSCLSCLGPSNVCITCNGSAMRYLNSTSSSCLCYTGYYDDGNNQMCGTCDYSCQTCVASTACLTCPTNRVLNGSYCSCNDSYYQNSINLNCLPCHYSCTTCSSYSVCSLCNSVVYRITNSNTTLCICSNGYYDNGVSQLCYVCSSICLTCSSYSVCTSCNSTLNMYLSSNTCLCTTLFYFNSGSQLCAACDYSCSSCSNGSACLSCQPNRTLIVGSTCLCISGLFDHPSTHICSSCAYPCVTCTISSSTCTSCDSNRTINLTSGTCICIGSTYDSGLACPSCLSTCQTCTNFTSCLACLNGSLRNLDGTGKCVCPTGYHDQNGTLLICKICNYTCTTCNSALSCLTCYTGRIASVGGYCFCPTNYFYDNGVNGQCIACAYSCLSCSVISTNCTSCLSSTFRLLSNGSCTCQQSYYDTGTAQCQSCQYSCLNCSSANSCSSCNLTNQRVYISGPHCSCMANYYDISNLQLCGTCNYACLTCISSSTICLTCPPTRTFDNISSCPCNSGYYDSGSATCSLCSYYCVTCSAALTCTLCPSTRQLNTSVQCSCINNYYDAGSQICVACSSLCLLCSNSQTCTACDTATNFRQLVGTSCVCPSLYFDASAQGNYTCQKCSYSCATCISLTRCTSCDITNYRVYNLNTTLCSCSNGYYDDGVNLACILCPYDCLTCSSATICLTCSTNRNLTSSRCVCNSNLYANGTLCESCPVECSTCLNSAQCTGCNGIRSLSSGSCVCPAGYYSVTGTTTCNLCYYTCLTCVTGTQCSTCNSTNNRYISGSSCLCRGRYYDDFVNQTCQACQYSCLSCGQNSSCLTCDSSIHRVYNPNTQFCDCISGYYQDATLICVQCPYNCLTCSSSTVCLSCNPTFSRVLNSSTNICDCPSLGYYDTMISPVCAVCDYTCHSCASSSTYCTSCLNSTFRGLSGSSCLCSNGYYNIVNQAICLSCSYQCVTCASSSTSCTLCSISNYRNVTPACTCLNGYYDDGIHSMCGTCNYQCQTCSNGITCSTCNLTAAFRSLNNITLMCDCINQYFDAGTIICSTCLYSCLTCQNPTSCLTCPSTRSLSMNSCLCLQQFYDDGVNVNCQACHYSCQSCLNGVSCFSCNSLNYRTYNSSTLLCSCIIGYYDTNTSLCVKCDASCYLCINGTSCSSCPPNINKTLNASSGSNFCVCLYGYYQNTTAGVLLGYNSVCNQCFYACQTCSSQSTSCTLCNSSSFRTLTSNRQCQCMTSYFEVSGQQQCLPCYTNCLSCFGTLANNCYVCNNSTYYLNNTCYVTCPAYYANPTNTSNRVCVSCPSNCLSCPQSTITCAQCFSTYFIFAYNSSYSVCIQNCPNFYYQINRTCYSCISPCLKCTAALTCTTCINNYYLTSGYCYPCQSSCLTCIGSTALDCLTCIPDYILKNSICQKLACSPTQYVQSALGCTECVPTFPNSLTCLSTGPLTCKSGYILSNNSCQFCSQVNGYTYDSTTGKCKDFCGDGIKITDLCDDGNNLNGDGCSSICTIESGWTCPNNSCTLTATPELGLQSLTNNPATHSLSLIIKLSMGLRLVQGNFILTFTGINNFGFTLIALDIYCTKYKLVITYYESPANNKLSLSIRSPITRLLVTAPLQLSINLNLSISVPIVTSPPAIYVSDAESNIYSSYLFGVVTALHILILLTVVTALWMRMKVMLLVIDALNSLTILYILAGLGAYGISLVSYQSMRGLQPFIYQFGTILADSTTNFYFFNYTQTFFSSCIVQVAVISFCLAMSLLKPLFSSHESEQNIWHYLKSGFVFAFGYDILLSCFSTFLQTSYSSYETSYSWAFAFIAAIYIFYEGLQYLVKMRSISERKIVPGVSFMTNELENKQKLKTDLNIFEFEDDVHKEKKVQASAQNSEDGRTEVLAQGISSKNILPTISYYDLTPSAQTQYSLSHSNHIKAIYLPVSSVLLAALYSIIVSIQSIRVRATFLLIISAFYLIFVFFARNESLRSIRIVKLLLLAIIYVIISILVLVTATLQQTINLKMMDIIIISAVCLGLVINFITFIVNVRYSEAYREYLVSKNNQQIIERKRKQNQTRQKLYYKNEPTFFQSKKPDISVMEPMSLDIIGQPVPEIQVSEEQVEQKELKLSSLKNRQLQSRTFIARDRDASQIVKMHIDDEISDMKDDEKVTSNRVMSRQKSPVEGTRNKVKSPDRSRQANRVKGGVTSQMSLISKKDTPSLLIDNTLERIDEFAPSKRIRRRKKGNREVELMDSDEQKMESRQEMRNVKSSKQEMRNVKSKLAKREEQQQEKVSDNIEQILEDMDMPLGFKEQIKQKSGKEMHAQKMDSIDDVSSIKEEREIFEQQQIGEQGTMEMNVFNKILQDYKIYKNKKIDHKRIRELKLKSND